MDNRENMRRIIIATILSFLFFVAYDYFVLQPQMVQQPGEGNFTERSVQKAPGGGVGEKGVPGKLAGAQLQKGEPYGVVEGKEFRIEFDQWGRIISYTLRDKRFEQDGKGLQLIDPRSPKPLEVRFPDQKLTEALYSHPAHFSTRKLELDGGPKELVIEQTLPGGSLKKILKFYPDGHYDLRVETDLKGGYFLSPGRRPDGVVDNLTIHGVLVKLADGKLRIVEDGDGEKEEFKNVKVVAGFDRYYTTLLLSKEPVPGIILPDQKGNPLPFLKLSGNRELTGYIGPKYVDLLRSIDPELVDVVQYGVGTFFARNLFLLLDGLYKLTHSWAIAIILLVVVVRIILFPLTWKGMVSMYKLKELTPKLKEIQERYKDDPPMLQKKMMELYQREGVNPLGGCLPLLLQIPVFYGIYKLLLYSIELKGAHFLWIKDLTEMDPYFILPILMGVTMYLHQRLTPTNFQDPIQEKVFKFMPLLFTFLMATFPAGLVLYWTVNNLLSLAQQWVINRLMEIRKRGQI
jgi:YidC/Oxa1 family membrane protein insertase